MTLKWMRWLGCVIIFAALWTCGQAGNDDPKKPAVDMPVFGGYWYQGKAEITRYDLQQARYGEIHSGDAVLIFVTEDFLTDRQVKYESGDRAQAVSVLKLNFTKKFNTGIYPYSLMTSVFTPVDIEALPHTLKVTNSNQEWCGHTFGQLNLENDRYKIRIFSYFQSEGDTEADLPAAGLEDEIWTRIRIAPDLLPLGNIQLIPGSQHLRLKHQVMQVEPAAATLTPSTDPSSGHDILTYTVLYEQLDRRLAIRFEKQFPHAILGWEESYRDGRGETPAIMTTTASRTHTLLSDYWGHNAVADSVWRKQLGLE